MQTVGVSCALILFHLFLALIFFFSRVALTTICNSFFPFFATHFLYLKISFATFFFFFVCYVALFLFLHKPKTKSKFQLRPCFSHSSAVFCWPLDVDVGNVIKNKKYFATTTQTTTLPTEREKNVPRNWSRQSSHHPVQKACKFI